MSPRYAAVARMSVIGASGARCVGATSAPMPGPRVRPASAASSAARRCAAAEHAPGEADLEGVVAETLGLVQNDVGRVSEGVVSGELSVQDCFGFLILLDPDCASSLIVSVSSQSRAVLFGTLEGDGM